jgi:hypothetical protein
MKLICKIFGHKWRYWFSSMEIPNTQIRVCKYCGLIQKYTWIPEIPKPKQDWISLIERTKLGVKEFIKLENFINNL